MNKIRISKTYASYFFDNTDYFLLNFFEEDVKESFKAFWSNNLPANKGPEDKMFKDGIDS